MRNVREKGKNEMDVVGEWERQVCMCCGGRKKNGENGEGEGGRRF